MMNGRGTIIMRRALSICLAVVNFLCFSASFAAEGNFSKVLFPYDDTYVIESVNESKEYVEDYVYVKGDGKQHGYFFFNLGDSFGFNDTAKLEIIPYSVKSDTGYEANLLVYTLNNQDMPTYSFNYSTAPKRVNVLSEFSPKEGEVYSIDVTNYIRNNISKRYNIGFAISNTDPSDAVVAFKSSENKDGASLKLVIEKNGGINPNELSEDEKVTAKKVRNLTLDCKEITYTKDITGVDIDKYTTTRYKPYLVNFHLADPYQIENDYYAGECGQAPYNICINPIDPNILLIGSDMESVYRSEDGGVTWKYSGYGLMSVGTQGLGFYPDDKNLAFAIMGKPADIGDNVYRLGQGIYKSTDCGKTWTLVQKVVTGYNNATRKGGSFAYSEPNESGIRRIYAATYNKGIYYSDDLGDSWNYMAFEDKGLAFIRSYENTIITGSRINGLYYSKDGGASWTNEFEAFGSKMVNDCIVDPDDNRHWYVCVSDMVYESFDEGASWQFMTDIFEIWNECYANGSGAADSRVGWLEFMAPDEDGHRILLSGTISGRYSIKYSEDYGKTWKTSMLDNKMAYIESNWGSNADPIAVHPYDPNIAWFSFDGEWFKTTDGAKTWVPSASGYSGNRACDFWFDPDDNDNIWIAFTDRGFSRSVPSGNGESYPAMTNDASEDLYDMRFDGRRDIDSIDRDPKNKNRYLINGKYGNNLLESLDGGWTWQYINVPAPTAGRVTFNVSDPEIIYAGKNVSYDDGKTWTEVPYRIMEASKVDGNVVWALDTSASSNLYKSYDAGKTWQYVFDLKSSIRQITADVAERDKAYIGTFSNGIHVDSAGQHTMITGMNLGEGNVRGFYQLAQNPKNPLHMIVCNLDHVNLSPSGGLSESFDGGKTWRFVDGMFGFGDAWCIEFHPNLPRVYIGTSHGTFVYEYDRYYDTNEKIYLDIDENDKKEKIEALFNKGILNKYHDGNFYPDSYFTRGEFAQIIKNALDLQCSSTKQVFEDIGIRSRDFVSVGALYEKGYVLGGENAYFNPNEYVTYDDAAVIISRILKSFGKSKDINSADIGEYNIKSANYAIYATVNCIDAKIIEISDGYNGSDYARRDDIANMIYNLMKVIGKTL